MKVTQTLNSHPCRCVNLVCLIVFGCLSKDVFSIYFFEQPSFVGPQPRFMPPGMFAPTETLSFFYPFLFLPLQHWAGPLPPPIRPMGGMGPPLRPMGGLLLVVSVHFGERVEEGCKCSGPMNPRMLHMGHRFQIAHYKPILRQPNGSQSTAHGTTDGYITHNILNTQHKHTHL